MPLASELKPDTTALLGGEWRTVDDVTVLDDVVEVFTDGVTTQAWTLDPGDTVTTR